MATIVPPPSKKARLAEKRALAEASTSENASNTPAPSVIVQFKSTSAAAASDDAAAAAAAGSSERESNIGAPIRLPSDTNKAGLELLVNQLAKAQRALDGRNDDEEDEDDANESTPFSFHVSITRTTKNEQGESVTTVQRVPVLKDLLEVIRRPENGVSVEDVIQVICEPEAVFKVRQITRCSSTLTGHGAPILCASFSPTGSMLATGSGDNTVRLWDLNTELPKTALTGHRGWILCVEWNGMETSLASGSHDNTVIVWDPKTGKQVGEALRGHTKWITGLAWEPVHLNASEPRLASASKDATVRVWNPKARRVEFTLGGHTASVNAVRWGGDGVIYTASSDRTVKLWNSDNGKLIRNLSEHAHWVNTLALNTDFILRTGPYDHTGRNPVDAKDAKAKALARYQAFVAQQPELLISGSDDHTLFLWPNVRAESNPKKPLARLTGHQKQICHVAFSPNGKLIASCGWDNSVKLWDGRTGKFFASLRGHVGPVYRVSFSSDSRMLVSASKDSTLKLWNLTTHKLKVDLPGHIDEVYCVDFVADKVASGGRDKTLKIWRN